MSKVLSYTPPWLSRPAPGFDLFPQTTDTTKGPQTSSASSSKSGPYTGHRRTIARRGVEVFVAVGNVIRWADLTTLKYDFEEKGKQSRHRSPSEDHGSELSFDDDSPHAAYKTLKPSVHGEIQQLITSPNNELMAIVTSHTVHVAIIPDSNHLTGSDLGPIRMKTHTLGPTIHVLQQAQVVNALWHPLGVDGQCLVTVTADAVVRLWELKRESRWSYDQPTVELDLSKLHHATSTQDDIKPAKLGENKGFSMDNLYMEVAAAAFGGTGSESEHGWSSMTLWIAMTEGDVYALCPLLPTKWQSPYTHVPSLTTSIVAKKAYAEGPVAHEELQRTFEAQLRWLSSLDDQDPKDLPDGFIEYGRPEIQGSTTPRLQGPFRIQPGDIEDVLELSDLYIIAPKLDLEELDDEEEFEAEEQDSEALSASMVCLVANSGLVYICLNLEEIEGQWLPSKPPKTEQKSDDESQPELVLLEALDTIRDQESHGPSRSVVTADIFSRYSFFITHREALFYISLHPWLQPLESELQSGSPEGSTLRMGTLKDASGAHRKRVQTFKHSLESEEGPVITAPVLFNDSDLGYFLLTSIDHQPIAATFDVADPSNQLEHSSTKLIQSVGYSDPQQAQFGDLETLNPRHPYVPSSIFWDHQSALVNFVETKVDRRHRNACKEELRLSSAILEVMTEAHRAVSKETHKIGLAAAELFTACTTVQGELQNQVKRVAEISDRIDKINDEDADNYAEVKTARGSEKLEERLELAQSRQKSLLERLDSIKKKLSQNTTKPLSKAESAWSEEVAKTAREIDPEHSNPQGRKKEIWQRYDETRELKEELIPQAKEAGSDDSVEEATTKSFKIPNDIRKQKLKQVDELLARQSAIVDGARERLSRLHDVSV